ncbi:MAG: ABC transporter permease [Candidatus Cloacimonetes bacterium]|nr:ABC transporter permease [Candidatus Cloacimonadota bacterium]
MNKYLKIEKAAIKSILRNKTRSLLTSLGIIIGVSSVIVMVALGQGSSKKIQTDIASMGSNLLMISPGNSIYQGISRGSGSQQSLTLDDCEMLIEGSQYLQAVSPSVNFNGQVIGGSGNWYTRIEGVNQFYPQIRNWEIAEGNFLTAKDIKAKKKVVVLGNSVAEELYPSGNAIGQKLRISNTPFTIIGILKKKGQNAMGMDQDDIILAPSTTVLSRLKGSKYGSYINSIYASAVSEDVMDEAETEITRLLMQSHKIQSENDIDFRIRTQSEILEFATSTTNTLTLLLGAIAGVSLLVGGIGIMNIMLVSVTERTKEIGIRMSVGARTRDILLQFLSESLTLSLIGGSIGILSAVLISAGLKQVTSLTPIIDPVIAITAFLFSGAVGVFFGFYPAKKAAELNPIDALHYE